jgi:hypothetical protein
MLGEKTPLEGVTHRGLAENCVNKLQSTGVMFFEIPQSEHPHGWILFYPVIMKNDLFIYSTTTTCLRGEAPPRLGHLAPASNVAGGHALPF